MRALLERHDEKEEAELYPAAQARLGAEADAVAALGETAWLARLQRAFGWRAGEFLATGPRSMHPALRLVAGRCIAARALLVGNAAQTLHPVGAQGFNLGLRDALTLAELVGADAAGDPGADALLDAYVRRREADRERTLAFSDGLARVTAGDAPLLRGDVPALCRGGEA
jgi:2-octaprenyl-6-methoxyphenol hydroxylase